MTQFVGKADKCAHCCQCNNWETLLQRVSVCVKPYLNYLFRISELIGIYTQVVLVFETNILIEQNLLVSYSCQIRPGNNQGRAYLPLTLQVVLALRICPGSRSLMVGRCRSLWSGSPIFVIYQYTQDYYTYNNTKNERRRKNGEFPTGSSLATRNQTQLGIKLKKSFPDL